MDKQLPARHPLLVAAICFVLVSSSGMSQEPVHYSKSELRQLIRHAATADDYQKLTLYFMEEERSYLVKAQAEQKTYNQAIKSITAARNPTRAETARAMAQYYTSKADQSGKVASQCEQKLAAIRQKAKNSASGTDKAGVAAQTRPPTGELTPSEKLLNQRLEELDRQMKQVQSP